MNVANHCWGCGASLFSEAMASRMNDDEASVSLRSGRALDGRHRGPRPWRYHHEARAGQGWGCLSPSEHCGSEQ
jgi:hypothetical protein